MTQIYENVQSGETETISINLTSVTANRFRDLKFKNLSDKDIVKFIKYRDQYGLKKYSDAFGAWSDILGDNFEIIKKSNYIFNRPNETDEFKKFKGEYEPHDRRTYSKLFAYLDRTKSSEFLSELIKDIRK